MTPFPPFGRGFHCGGLVRCPVCCGVIGFVLGGGGNSGVSPHRLICDGSKPPPGGTTPSTKHLCKTETYNL